MGIEILSLKCGLSEATYSSTYPMRANFEFDPNKEHSVRCPFCNKRIHIYLGKYSANGRIVDMHMSNKHAIQSDHYIGDTNLELVIGMTTEKIIDSFEEHFYQDILHLNHSTMNKQHFAVGGVYARVERNHCLYDPRQYRVTDINILGYSDRFPILTKLYSDYLLNEKVISVDLKVGICDDLGNGFNALYGDELERLIKTYILDQIKNRCIVIDQNIHNWLHVRDLTPDPLKGIGKLVFDFFDEHRSFFVSNIEQRGYVWPRIKQGEKNSPLYQPERPPRVSGPDIKAYGGEDKLSIDKHDRYWVICAMVIVVIILITSILSWSV